MKIEKTKKQNKVTLIIIVASLLLLAAGTAMYFTINYRNSQKPSVQEGLSNTPHTSDDEQSQNLKDNPDYKERQVNSDKPTAPQENSSDGKQKLQMVTSYSIANDTLYIRGGINYPVGDGSCYALLLSPTGQEIRKDTTLLQNPASTDCKTIAIPIAELSLGTWTFTLHYTSNAYEGVSNEETFSI